MLPRDIMAHIHIGQLTATKQCAKHLRPFGERDFWKRERKESCREAASRIGD